MSEGAIPISDVTDVGLPESTNTLAVSDAPTAGIDETVRTPKRKAGRPQGAKDKKPRIRPPVIPNMALESSIGGMVGLGIPVKRIAAAMDMSEAKVKAVLQRPGTAQFAVRAREAFKGLALATTVNLAPEVDQWLGEIVVAKDHRAFAAVTKGLGTLEQISASASGESRKSEVMALHAVQGDVKVEIATLLGDILEDDSA